MLSKPLPLSPTRTGEVPPVVFQPPMPRPEDQDVWGDAHRAARCFWERAAADTRLSPAFRAIASQNAEILVQMSTADAYAPKNKSKICENRA